MLIFLRTSKNIYNTIQYGKPVVRSESAWSVLNQLIIIFKFVILIVAFYQWSVKNESVLKLIEIYYKKMNQYFKVPKYYNINLHGILI